MNENAKSYNKLERIPLTSSCSSLESTYSSSSASYKPKHTSVSFTFFTLLVFVIFIKLPL